MYERLLKPVELVVVLEGDEEIERRHRQTRVLQVHRHLKRRPDSLNLRARNV